MHKSGFVSIIGSPNVGKSTLLNELVGAKVAITSSKVQTTRCNIKGIVDSEKYQIVLIDTPGFHKPLNKMGLRMNSAALEATIDAELILLLMEAGDLFGLGDKMILNKIKSSKAPLFIILTKTDIYKPKFIARKINDLSKIENVTEIIPISVKTNHNIDTLLKLIIKTMPNGPKYFNPQTKFDKNNEFMLAELIREQVLHKTSQEIPHGVATIIENMKYDRKKGLFIIDGLIYVKQKSHKPILVGKGGSMISSISKDARFAMEKHLNKKVYLNLYVKVNEKWFDQKSIINLYGYEK